MKKYELTDETNEQGFFRIKALRDFGGVKEGDIGGFIESEDNLSHEGNAWVRGNARVFGNAQVYGNARVYGNAQVCGDALVSGNAQVCGDALVFGNALVSGNARIYGIRRSDGYTFVAVPCSDNVVRVIAGCRYFTFEEAYDHWNKTRKGTPLGDETLSILRFIQEQAAMKGFSG